MSTPETRLWRFLTRYDIGVLRFASSLSREQVKALREIGRSLRAELSRVNPSGVKRKHYQEARLKKLLKIIDAILVEGFKAIQRDVQKEMIALTSRTAERTVEGINVALQAELARASLDAQQIRSITDDAILDGEYVPNWYPRLRDRTRDKIRQQLRLGLVSGEGVHKMAERLKTVVTRSERELEALVRSSVISTTTASRLEVYRQNADVIDGVEWISTLDKRTSLQCIARDGLRWDINGKPYKHTIPLNAGPPAHFNCRSTLSAYFKSKLPDSVRATGGGPIQGDTTFNRFLRDIGDKDAAKMLGRTRFELYKSGKITLKDILDSRGDVRSVSDL